MAYRTKLPSGVRRSEYGSIRRVVPPYLRSTHSLLVAANRTISRRLARPAAITGSPTGARITSSPSPVGILVATAGVAPCLQPCEKFRKRGPECFEWRQHRQLVSEHGLPITCQLVPEWLECGKAWHRYSLEVTFLSDDIENRRPSRPEHVTPKEIDHIVKIPWSGAFAQCADLLAEDLLKRIATHGHAAILRTVGVGMRDNAVVGWEHHPLTGSQVGFDPGETTSGLQGTPIVDASLSV